MSRIVTITDTEDHTRSKNVVISVLKEICETVPAPIYLLSDNVVRARMLHKLPLKLKRQLEQINMPKHNTTTPICSMPPLPEDGLLFHLHSRFLWTPPHQLVYSGTQWSWTGLLERFELVKSASRGVNKAGQELTDKELNFCVEMYEHGEQLLCSDDFQGACDAFLTLVEWFPGFALVYWKAAVALLALYPAPESHILVLSEATGLFRCAVSLEPNNTAIRENIDLVLKMLSGSSEICDRHWSSHGAPKSEGDLKAFLAILMATANFARAQAEDIRKMVRTRRGDRHR